MKIINDLGMPEHAFRAICRRQGRLEPPTLDYIGVTTLMGAPLPRFLFARYWHELEVKASDTMNAIQGQLGHLLFAGVDTDTRQELSLETDFEGAKIKGIADYYDPHTFTLGDSKFKQVNSVTATNIRGDDYLETQLNIYCWLAGRQGTHVEHLQGDIYINGWTRYKALAGSNYPPAPYVKVDVPIWTENFTTNYIRERVRVHDTEAIRILQEHGIANGVSEAVDNLLDAAEMLVPICTDKERFAQPTRYAVMKEGQKKAVKLFDSCREADEWLSNQKNALKLNVAERKGGYMNCLWYCNTRQFCPHVKNSLDMGKISV